MINTSQLDEVVNGVVQSIRLREARDINEGNASRSVTTGITDMRVMFHDTSSFN